MLYGSLIQAETRIKSSPMTDEETLTPEELKEKIWEKFGDQLISMGATGADHFDIEIAEEPPTEQEISKDRCIAQALGKIGKYSVMVIRCAYGVSRKAFGVILVYVTLMGLPEALERSKQMFPNTHAIVQKIARRLEDGTILKPPEEEEDQEYSGKYIVFYHEWLENPDLFERDWARIRQAQTMPYRFESRPVFLPATSTSAEITASSSGPFDYGDDETA
jgi:hypothetical protein